jgi:hypothetical protein
MFKLVSLIVLAAVQLGTFCVAAANPGPLAPGSNFSVALINLEDAAAAFTSAPYSGVFPPNIPELEVGRRQLISKLDVETCDRESSRL